MPAVDSVLDHGRRLHLAVEHDGKAVFDVSRGQFSKLIRALRIKLKTDSPAALVECRVSLANPVPEQIGALPHKQFLLELFPVALLVDDLDAVAGRNDLGTGFDGMDEVIALRMHQAELEFRDFLQLLARLLDFRGVEPGNLHKDPVLALRRDHRLADAELVHALVDDSHRLFDHALVNFPVAFLDEADQERRAALQIEAKLQFATLDHLARCVLDVIRRIRGKQAKAREEQRENRAEDALARAKLGGEIPSEEDQQDEADDESPDWAHGILGVSHWQNLKRQRLPVQCAW